MKRAYYGIVFDSQIEAARYLELRASADRGEISGLGVQPRMIILPKAPGQRERIYTADFIYTVPPGRVVVEEVKPKNKKARSWSRDFPLRLALAKAAYPQREFRVVIR